MDERMLMHQPNVAYAAPMPPNMHMYNPNITPTTIPHFQPMVNYVPMISSAHPFAPGPNFYVNNMTANVNVSSPGQPFMQQHRMPQPQPAHFMKRKNIRLKHPVKKETHNILNGHINLSGDGYPGVNIYSHSSYMGPCFPGSLVQAATGVPIVMHQPYMQPRPVHVPVTVSNVNGPPMYSAMAPPILSPVDPVHEYQVPLVVAEQPQPTPELQIQQHQPQPPVAEVVEPVVSEVMEAVQVKLPQSTPTPLAPIVPASTAVPMPAPVLQPPTPSVDVPALSAPAPTAPAPAPTAPAPTAPAPIAPAPTAPAPTAPAPAPTAPAPTAPAPTAPAPEVNTPAPTTVARVPTPAPRASTPADLRTPSTAHSSHVTTAAHVALAPTAPAPSTSVKASPPASFAAPAAPAVASNRPVVSTPAPVVKANATTVTLPPTQASAPVPAIVAAAAPAPAANAVTASTQVTTAELLVAKETSPLAVDSAPKSWASLFKSKGAAAVATVSTEKPTARVEPFSPSSDKKTNHEALSPMVRAPVDDTRCRLAKHLADYEMLLTPFALLPRGLTNKNNWCYINATLQALIACPPFVHLIKSLAPFVSSRAGQHHHQHHNHNQPSSTPVIDSVYVFLISFQVQFHYVEQSRLPQ